MPLQVWAWCWLACATVCTVQAFTKPDRAAFVVAAALQGAWGGAFIVGFFLYGLQRAWLSSIIYFILGGLTLIHSGWRENTPPPPEHEGKVTA